MKNVKVLGAGCANCKNTIKLIDEVTKAKGVEVQLEKVEQIQDIMEGRPPRPPKPVQAPQQPPQAGVPGAPEPAPAS